MRTNRWAVGAVLVGALAMTGCGALGDIFGDNTTIDDHSVKVNINPPASPSPSPSPSATPLPGGVAPRSVFASMFGERCPVGVIPANESRTIRKGCTANLTCTAILVDGRDAGTVFPGSRPDAFALSDPGAAPPIVRLDSAGDAWNRDAVGLNAGTAEIYCSFGGLDSRTSDGPWILTVKS